MHSIYDTPVLLKSAYFSYIWGGTLLRDKLNKPITADDIGESWELSAHPRGQSIVASGPAIGMPLAEYAGDPKFYGKVSFARFPLLIKLLGATSNLSVQVHPSDTNCRTGEAGKAEAWYVIDCEPGATLIYDINGTKEEFALAVADGLIKDKLRYLPVQPGDVLDIPAGMVHALTAGIVIYEVQQNSDTTYRLYDWDRVDAATGKARELHIEAALNVIEPRNGLRAVRGRMSREFGGIRTIYINNPYYTLEKIELDGTFTDIWFDSFAAYTVVSGSGTVSKGGEECFSFTLGDTFVSPAAAGPVELTGRAVLLKSHVPPMHSYHHWIKNLPENV